MVYEDISVFLPIEQTAGNLYNTVYYFDPQITEVEIRTEKLSETTKNIIFRIYYSGNFSEVKAKLIEKLKEFPNLEMRS